MIWGVGQFVLIWRGGGESLQISASLWRFVTNVQIDPVDGFLWNWGKLRLGLRCSYSFMMKFKVFSWKLCFVKYWERDYLKYFLLNLYTSWCWILIERLWTSSTSQNILMLMKSLRWAFFARVMLTWIIHIRLIYLI